MNFFFVNYIIQVSPRVGELFSLIPRFLAFILIISSTFPLSAAVRHYNFATSVLENIIRFRSALVIPLIKTEDLHFLFLS